MKEATTKKVIGIKAKAQLPKENAKRARSTLSCENGEIIRYQRESPRRAQDSASCYRISMTRAGGPAFGAGSPTGLCFHFGGCSLCPRLFPAAHCALALG